MKNVLAILSAFAILALLSGCNKQRDAEIADLKTQNQQLFQAVATLQSNVQIITLGQTNFQTHVQADLDKLDALDRRAQDEKDTDSKFLAVQNQLSDLQKSAYKNTNDVLKIQSKLIIIDSFMNYQREFDKLLIK